MDSRYHFIQSKEEAITLLKTTYSAYGRRGFEDACFDRYRDDPEVASQAIQSHNSNFRYVSERLKDDDQLAMMAVKIYGSNFEWASRRLQNNKVLLLEALKTYHPAYQFASVRLKTDKDVILFIVSENGLALEEVPPPFHRDKDVVLKALQHTGWAFRYAHPDLKDDPEIAIAAVTTTPKVYKCCLPITLLNNKHVLLAALQDGKNNMLVKDAHQDLQRLLKGVENPYLKLKSVIEKEQLEAKFGNQINKSHQQAL